ncbi:MAG: ASCH domain-containing protein [Rhizobiaceae bacterium]|nr:ASCH domain-containing protein [Rhizobiaceae bacterium]
MPLDSSTAGTGKPLISKGLIIADPWISLILNGQKDWEMRSTATTHRGWFALIWKGTGAVYGVARLRSVGVPLSPSEMVAAYEHHKIPEAMVTSGQVAKWTTPWQLSEVIRLPSPVRYRHKDGAVTWVNLDDRAGRAISTQLETLLLPVYIPTIERQENASPGLPIEAKFIGECEISQGNIDHNHLYLRSFFDRFPADAVGGSNKSLLAARTIAVDWGGSESVVTDLDGSKKFFRARGWISRFFKQNNVHAGQKVLVEEIGPYHYRVRLP